LIITNKICGIQLQLITKTLKTQIAELTPTLVSLVNFFNLTPWLMLAYSTLNLHITNAISITQPLN